MQLQDQTFPAATMFNYLFDTNRARNRLEFIDDFPNQAEVISSLEIHPMGWSAVSRNITADERQEVSLLYFFQLVLFNKNYVFRTDNI